MEGFRAEIRSVMAANDDPAFVAATQAALDHEWMVTSGILAGVTLFAVLNIAAGLIMLKRDWKEI